MLRWLACVLAFLVAAPAWGAEPTLAFKREGETVTLTRSALLARPDVETITVPGDVAYGRTMQYRAIPVLSLLTDAGMPVDKPMEVIALDGFMAQFPAEIFKLAGADAARAYLAIEPPDAPWPKLEGKSASAGPFYVVWINPQASRIASEFWPYQVASFEITLDPVTRWPQIDVASSVPANDPARRGLTVFIENCFACHRMNGGGESMVGPDLNLPMNPTEYFQAGVLRTFIRDPEQVRTWPDHGMTGFEVDALPDEELDDLIAYLKAMVSRRG